MSQSQYLSLLERLLACHGPGGDERDALVRRRVRDDERAQLAGWHGQHRGACARRWATRDGCSAQGRAGADCNAGAGGREAARAAAGRPVPVEVRRGPDRYHRRRRGHRDGCAVARVDAHAQRRDGSFPSWRAAARLGGRHPLHGTGAVCAAAARCAHWQPRSGRARAQAAQTSARVTSPASRWTTGWVWRASSPR